MTKRDEALEALEAKVRELTRAATGGRESTAMTKRDEGMSDERLEDIRNGVEDANLLPWIDNAFGECFAEIDRLRAELAELERQENSTSAAVATVQEWINGRIAALEAEVERLRERLDKAERVLTRIWTAHYPGASWVAEQYFVELRDALRDGEEKKG